MDSDLQNFTAPTVTLGWTPIEIQDCEIWPPEIRNTPLSYGVQHIQHISTTWTLGMDFGVTDRQTDRRTDLHLQVSRFTTLRGQKWPKNGNAVHLPGSSLSLVHLQPSWLRPVITGTLAHYVNVCLPSTLQHSSRVTPAPIQQLHMPRNYRRRATDRNIRHFRRCFTTSSTGCWTKTKPNSIW